MIASDQDFVMVPNTLITDQRISHVGIRLWIHLNYYADKPDHIFPAWETLAAGIGCSPTIIRRPFSELIEGGWIIPVGKGYELIDAVSNPKS